MPTQIKITVSENAREILRTVETLPEWMGAAVAKSLDQQNQLTVRYIDQLYLSFPKDGPTTPLGCRHITGRLKQSIRNSQAVIAGNTVRSAIGSNVVYAAVQEFGFDGNVTVSPHLRKNVREHEVFGKRRLVRKADIGVRSHTRHMKIEGRGFVQRGIQERAGQYTAALSAAIVNSWNRNGAQ